MTENTQPETVSINQKELAEFVIFNAFEMDAVDMMVPDGIRGGEIAEAVNHRNVTDVTSTERHIEVEGEFTARRHVRTIPAGGGPPGEPPTNPPEAVFEEAPMGFNISYYLEDFGDAEGVVFQL